MEIEEPAIAYSQQKISIEAYLEMENNALEKHEYYQDEVFAMPGAKVPHNMISSNLLATLWQKLKGNHVNLLTVINEYILLLTHYLLIRIFLLFAAK